MSVSEGNIKTPAFTQVFHRLFWRRRGDSNSRSRSPQTNDLANRPLQPLGYSSRFVVSNSIDCSIKQRGKPVFTPNICHISDYVI